MRRSLFVVAVAAATVALTACSTLERFNILRRSDQNASREGAGAPPERQRIPILALDDQLKVNDTLKGTTFFLPPAAPIADWPLPGGTPEQSVEHVDAGRAFRVAWRRDIGRKSTRSQFITAPPVGAAGKIFTMDAGATVQATDARTGRPLWRVNMTPKTLPNGQRPGGVIPFFNTGPRLDTKSFGGGIAFADGRLYVASGYRFVAALDANTGAVIWRTFVDTPIHAAPTVADGRVYAAGTSNELYTFDAATGAQGWQHEALVEPARILQASSPAISGDTVVAAFSSGEVFALRASNGNEIWAGNLTRVSRTTALSEIRDIPDRPVVYKGDVYAGSHSGIFGAIDFRTGQLRWELPIVTVANPWAAGDVVFTVSKAGEVICIARQSGLIYWIRDLNTGRRSTRITRWLGREVADRSYWTGPILASGRLVTASSDGRMAALNPQTGEVMGYLDLKHPVLISPIAMGEMLYVVTDDGELIAIR